MERIIHTLSNGMRVVAEQTDGHVSYIGVLTNAGSRDDFPGPDGLAHFVEHTLFKGTASRSSWHISNRMESVGGELNAYTTKEEIMLYANSPAGYEERAIELLSDLISTSRFPEQEINLERGVILEEIHSYRDNPSFAVFDEFDELFFRGSGLAHNILGYNDTVSKIRSDDARDFLHRNFAPKNMVMYCSGPSKPEKNIRLIEKYFGGLSRPERTIQRTMPQKNPGFDNIIKRDNHQANALMGTGIFRAADERRYALYLFSNLLGGPGMNSRLNRELRERRGLVYTVESNVSLYSDTGVFQIYFGCEHSKVEKCTSIINREIRKLAEDRLSERMFGMAKRQLCGQLIVGCDNRENCAMGNAKSLMRHGEVYDSNHTADCIRNLRPEDLRQIAELIASGEMSRLILT